MGHDYHWFKWKTFKERMKMTYMSLESPLARDRICLCRMLIVFALGETFVQYPAASINLATTASVSDEEEEEEAGNEEPPLPPAPGADFFDQALLLLKLPYEEPTVDQVEILNLAVCRI